MDAHAAGRGFRANVRFRPAVHGANQVGGQAHTQAHTQRERGHARAQPSCTFRRLRCEWAASAPALPGLSRARASGYERSASVLAS